MAAPARDDNLSIANPMEDFAVKQLVPQAQLTGGKTGM
jgi:hypothetical protein